MAAESNGAVARFVRQTARAGTWFARLPFQRKLFPEHRPVSNVLSHYFVKNVVTIVIAVLSIFCTGCGYTDITEMKYHGPAVCRGGGGMVEESHGIPIWSGGTPDRKYHVLCGIQFEWIEDGTETASKKYLEAVATVIYIAKTKGAHAMINIGFESKTVGHRQSIPIRANKQYFQLIQYL